ncbi:MAG: RNA-binding S4 domain-containing protein [Bacteroidia bacterium]|nr:RNA-binding S4 domain-containing protein [Bacteroidia bacterium]
MEIFELHTSYIQLNQLLKAMGWCNDGAQANAMIDDGLVLVNGQQEFRRRNKIVPGTTVKLGKQEVQVVKAGE